MSKCLLNSTGCPDNWVIFGNECYKFEINSPKVYEEATADCWVGIFSITRGYLIYCLVFDSTLRKLAHAIYRMF